METRDKIEVIKERRMIDRLNQIHQDTLEYTRVFMLEEASHFMKMEEDMFTRANSDLRKRNMVIVVDNVINGGDDVYKIKKME
jgi:hypothetical protein